jgi:hypothetical protein
MALLAITIRYPRTVFIESPLAIIKFPFTIIIRRLALPFGFLIALFGLIIGKDISNEYRTRRRRYLTFSGCNKFLLTTGTDEQMVKTKIIEGIESIDAEVRIEEFEFSSGVEQTITIPPKNISFHDFNYLVQWLTDGKVRTVGLVENKRMTYTVYDDPDTTNLIGQTDLGEKFFISLADNFNKRQFLRINDEIELVEEYNISRIKSELSAQQPATHINHPPKT